MDIISTHHFVESRRLFPGQGRETVEERHNQAEQQGQGILWHEVELCQTRWDDHSPNCVQKCVFCLLYVCVCMCEKDINDVQVSVRKTKMRCVCDRMCVSERESMYVFESERESGEIQRIQTILSVDEQ